jgi:amino acid adenylation domain-containing protein
MNAASNQGFRLSAQQEHLWRLQQSAPGERFHAVARISIAGDLDPEVLWRALARVVERHEILRTTFQHVPGVTIPLQVIAEEAAPVAGDREEMDQRLRLERLEPGRHRLTVTLPALCADAATLDLLPAEIGRCYAACLGGEEPEPPAMQYADFTEWQAEVLESEETAAGREHWARLNLSRSTGEEPGAPGRLPVPLDPALAARWEEIARRCGAPLDAVLLAAWQTLLQQLSGEPEVTVAVAFAGRKFDELREAFGLYAAYLPVTGGVEGDASFSERVRRVQAAVEEAGDWQECFSWRQRVSQAEPEPFLPYAFSWREPAAPFSAAGLTFAVEEAAARIDRCAAELHAERRDGGLALELRHGLPAGAAERLAGRLLALLRGLAAAPEAPDTLEITPGEIEILSEPELRQLDDLNATAAPFPSDLCFHTWFERQAARTPEAHAVLHGGSALTYRELNERANRLARHLRRLGVGPEVRVGICLERSLEMVVGILGILKAGGAYVPIDPAYPAERRSLMFAELDGPALLTLERHREALAGAGLPLLCLDTEWDVVAHEAAEDLGATAVSENLAYVIFTSGSTGRPKGVLIAHRNLVGSTHARVLRYGEVESFLLLSSFAFDSSVAGIFGTLASGGTLVLPDEEAPRDVPRIAALLAEHRISHLLCLPSLHAALLDLAAPAWRRLRVVIVAGEACPAALLARHRERLPEAELWNEYGPTEGTVWSTVQRLVPGPEDVLIGRPVANVRVHLASPRLRRVPLGVPGELFVAGAGVARGYHGRPDLTAERFLPDPWPNSGSNEPGGRMYRTGDLVRHREDGTLDFLGRADNQVKIRGYRIELEEVEAALARHPALREVAVAAREEGSGDRRLVAYFTAAPGAPGVAELRAWLRERLPEPMVPAVFVPLSDFPRTPNGKVDRKALPAPGAEQETLRGRHVPPAGVIEEIIADVWSGVLGLERVGVTESFFDLGGHSLLATQVVSRLREALQVDLTLAWLFEAPTVRGLAARVEGARAGFVAPPVERADRDRPLPLSFAQQRLWFLQQMDPASTAYNVPGVYLLSGDLDVAALEGAVREIARRHEVLRTTFPSLGAEPVQRIHPPAPVRIPQVDLTALPIEARRPEAERLALEEIRTPFDLAAGPVLRLLLLRLGKDEHALCLDLHHIVSDGWSFDVLVRELTALYTGLASGAVPELPALPIQYADFAVWQRGWLQGERLEAELAFWREQLAGVPPVLDLATDRPRPAVQSFRGVELPFHWGADLSQDLLALGRAEGVTPFMLLLAAFQSLLARSSRQYDLCVGSPIAGRNRWETEPLIGFFVNTLVLRAELSGDPELRQILHQARERTLLAHAHQDLPFEKLVEELEPERSLAHTPLFQAVLAWQHPAPAGRDLPGLRMTPIELDGGTVKFDLMLSVRETPSGLEGAISYGSDLFHEVTIRRLLGHLRSLLESVRARPEARLSELDLLSSSERLELISAGRARTALPAARCLQDGFEDQARRHPEAVALEYQVEGGQGPESALLTYGELDRNANRLAHYLRGLGVGPEVRVGLCLERSPRMIAAILGVLKAGGAYVPLDPESPAERLAFLLADAGAPVLLTESRLLERLPTTGGSHVVCLDEISEALERESPERPKPRATPGNLAYVIYTSGSTGRPKGSLITHANVVRLFAATEPWFGFGPEDVWTLFHSYAFDFSVWEIWGALLYGGRLILVPFWVSRSPDSFRELLARCSATVVSLTPSAFRQLVEAEAPGLPPLALRRVVFGGEALDLTSLEPWLARYGDRSPELVNMYGITETTVHVTWRRMRRTDLDMPWSSVIGQPIPDLGIHLLDEGFEPVPPGVPGEIHVSGAGLGRGYLGHPGLTAERFVPDPFATAPGERLYRSGDLARYRSDGELEYLGRIDQQVKVRGFRIELGEIQAALEAHPAVAEAAVLAREGGLGDRRLAAYLVAAGEAPRTGELRGFLHQRLPDYMVPADFVWIEQLPLTRNGKLDRRALAALERSSATEGDWTPPRTPLEEAVAGIWSEVLGCERVGALDDFFDLGGHSLLATQVIGRLRSALGREISLRLLFEARTVGQLARHLEADGGAVPEGAPIEIAPRSAPDLDELLLELEQSA